MTDKLDVEVTGKSIYEVAHEMATQVLFSVESKKWGAITRQEYLRAHYDALRVLRGHIPQE